MSAEHVSAAPASVLPAGQPDARIDPGVSAGRPGDTMWVRFLSYLHGDRYMVGAYPPEWQDKPAPPTATQAGER